MSVRAVHTVCGVMLFLVVWSTSGLRAEDAPAQAPSAAFAKDVKPILQRKCVSCHGALKQKAGLRLDAVQLVRQGGGGGPAVIAGKPDESLLVEALEGREGVAQMPPEGGPLKPEEIAAIKAWIAAGALGADETVPEDPNKHWSFQKVRRPAVPMVDLPDWNPNPIDALIRAPQQAAGITPVGLAPKEVLLRRVTLDLIGLPPTVAELDAFLADESPEAFERVVDQLLARPEYAQRWARHWMDVWRYSDWDGYADEVRESQPHIWRWRDWIVDSLAADKPYDQMVREMLAADEIAPADTEALRATGFLVRQWFKFNRNVWLDNAIEHTGKAFLGLTFNCSRCHDHFYDPIAQPEYYQLRAFFEPYDIRTDPVNGDRNPNTAGLVRAYDKTLDATTVMFIRGDEARPDKDRPQQPVVPKLLAEFSQTPGARPLPPAAYYPGLDAAVFQKALAEAEAKVVAARDAVDKARAEWIAASEAAVAVTRPSPAPAAPAFELAESFDVLDAKRWVMSGGNWTVDGGVLRQDVGEAEPAVLRLTQSIPADFELSAKVRITGGPMWKSAGIGFDEDEAGQSAARVFLSASAGSKVQLYLRDSGKDVYPPSALLARPVMVDTDYRLTIQIRGTLVNVWVDDQLAIAFTLPRRISEGRLTLFTYSASAVFDDLRIRSLPGDVILTDNVKSPPSSPASQSPAQRESSARARVSKSSTALARAELVLAAAERTVAAVPLVRAADVARFAEPAAANAPDLARKALVAQRLAAAATARLAVIDARELLREAREKLLVDGLAGEAIKAAKTKVDELAGKLTASEAALVAAVELAGNSDGKTDYETFTPVYPASSSGRRAALAAMITAKENPLFARVAVNHLWTRHLGEPLVASMFDFGVNGQKPSNPELLDWLAAEFVDSGFRMKSLHKRIVTSRVYRLHSAPGDNAARKSDPDNRLLWRFKPRRAEAEAVRDSVLAVAGSLDTTAGGPDLDPEKGQSILRRTLYFRGSKEKRMTFTSLFDGPNVSECYRRAESIVPQQALALANSPLTRTQSRVLAARLAEKTASVGPEARDQAFVVELFRTTLSRRPTADEQADCLAFLASQSAVSAAPDKLTTFAGAASTDSRASADGAQRARENLCHVLLNHHEFVTIR